MTLKIHPLTSTHMHTQINKCKEEEEGDTFRNRIWWHMLIILPFGGQKQGGYMFKASLGYIVSSKQTWAR